MSIGAPAALSSRAPVEAELIEVQGRRLTFTVTARDKQGLVSRGKHARAVIDRQRFTDRLCSHAGASR